MLIPEDRIRAGVLDPFSAVRCQALEYWRVAHLADPTVMPLVIDATMRYGHKESFSLLREAEHITQTAETVDWLMAEIDQPLDLDDVVEDNYRFALALILVAAEPALLIPRHKAILRLRNFPERLAARLDRRLRFSLLEWPALWRL